jgi:cell cycle sensor histidine kinase DivJ
MASNAPKPSAKQAGKTGFLKPGAALAPYAPRVALALGATSLPLCVFGLGAGNSLLVTLSGVALLTALGVAAVARWQGYRQRNRVQTDRALAFEDLIENMRDAVVQYGADGRLLACSKSTTAMLGCAGFELEADSLIERVHVLDRPLFMTSFAAAQKDGERKTIQVRMRRDRKDAGKVPEFIWVEIYFSPNRQPANQQERFAVTATLRDVTQRRQDEQKLREVQAAAEEASKAKNQFLAVIGHELRTPLNAIVGFSDMMANGIGGALEPVHLEYVQLISQSGHHLLEMVNMLLDKSKIDAGRFELQAERFEPEKLVAPCVQIVSKSAREKNVELDVQLGKNLPEILADERACRQILINLLSNAVKFTEAGGKVTWTMKRRGAYLAINVSDTGIGMSPEVVARLGETFFQAQSSADRHFEGTGLGVSIVKGLVDLHGGKMNVQSVPGEGTSVDVLLPINGVESTHDVDTGITSLRGEPGEAGSAETSEQKLKRLA